jgi:NAD(P)-dependent dehydrogenase (short-subunit alcohol dehydrogenase family)
MARLRDQVAIVTGASSGIGRSTAELFAAEGARIVLVGRDGDALREVASSIGTPTTTLAIHDLTSKVAAEEVVAATIDAYGRLDVVVNAAGIIKSGTIETTSDEDWSAMMATNVDAIFRLMRAAVAHLRASRGRIVNISSVNGQRAFPGVLAYNVSKAAVDQLTRCAALELAADGVRVNAVNPGVTVTQLHRRGGMEAEAYEAFLEHSKTTHPLGRPGSPRDIAEAVLFLASDASDWITGETICVDGGRHQTCAR